MNPKKRSANKCRTKKDPPKWEVLRTVLYITLDILTQLAKLAPIILLMKGHC